MANNFLETKTITLGELLGNGKSYKVPPYQRDYSWNEEKWEDLFLDITDLENSKHPHCMGAIVLQTSNNKQYSIIDGQQRITTLSIFIIAVIKLLKDLVELGIDKEANQQRVDYFSRTFLGDIEPKQLYRVSKLELNSVNDSFFSTYIVQFKTPAKAILIKEDNSNKLLLKAYDYFYKKLNEKLKDNGEEIASYLSDFIADKIKFIQISVEDELNAYTLFETLNARGVELTSTDLLKNYLFSLVGDGTTRSGSYKVLLSDWNTINNVVGTKDFPNFLRYFINSKQTMERVYNRCAIKIANSEITNSKDVFDNLKSIYVDDETFENSFSSVAIDIGKRKLIKYILVNIENQKSNSDIGYEESDATIEHILPQNIDTQSEWSENFSDDEIESFTSRVGNYLLLEVAKNKDIGNKNFDEKIEVYKTSKYVMTNSFNYNQWNSDKIRDHQKEFAKIAKSVWRIG